MNYQETTIWQGRPSQIINAKFFIMGIVGSILIIPIGIAIWKWIEVRSRLYELTTERLRIRTGVLNKSTEEIELYRIKDTQLVEPFMYRLFKSGNLILHTSDRTTPVIFLEAIPEAETLKEHIRRIVEQLRFEKGVREVDF